MDDKIGILNFYVVKNEAVKNDEETDGFKRYCKLRDDSKKAFYVHKGCSRRWMNRASDKNDEDNRGSSGINYLWPDTGNQDFRDALDEVKEGAGFKQACCDCNWLFIVDGHLWEIVQLNKRIIWQAE